MRLHFKTAINLDGLYDDVKTNKVGAVHMPERADTVIMIDMYDDATQNQISTVINKARNNGLSLIWAQPGTFVVK